MEMPRIVISAAHRSSGKTTVAIGLCAAFAGLGRSVQAFKKGPDYIDPMWLSAASGRSCRNLDHYLMGEEDLLSVFSRGAEGADINIIEGNAGLFDSIDVDGKGSTATLARLLDAPVVLVVDCHGMNRGIAP
ncbi:MAG: cobyrinic acid a,c-diamide synthase, partial [Nitrospirae bacterium]|nr:cobyrinic acid a,c-diamide synthase [Nitrospirota bacterium]